MIVSFTRRFIWPIVAVIALFGVFYLGAFPVRTFLDQRKAAAAAETRLSDLTAENDALQSQIDLLSTDKEIERIAREQYGLVMPDEEVYRVLPAPGDPVRTPDVWPFQRLGDRLISQR